jgi:hypothetical protein
VSAAVHGGSESWQLSESFGEIIANCGMELQLPPAQAAIAESRTEVSWMY